MLRAFANSKTSNIKRFYSSRFQGKVAVVTASTEGIGFAIANRLASEGAAVVISSRNEQKVSNAVQKLREKNYNVEGVVCHVGNAEHRKQLFETAVSKYNGLDILVSNAGIFPASGASSLLKTEEKMWDKVFDVNVKAAWLLSKEAAPLMKGRTGANILFVSSLAGYQVHRESVFSTYSVSKTTLLALTKSIAGELAPKNIRVNSIAPGIIATQFSANLTATEQSRRLYVGAIPMGRTGSPEEVAAVAAFLCSEEASFVTAENMVVGGGQVSRL